jgi:DNA-binding CsgD family transcriptional regulator
VVGGDFESFTADAPTGALELLIAGRLNGYEGVRRFRLRDGATEPFHFWVRAIGDEIPQRFVLVTIMVDGRPAGSAPCPLPGAFNIVIGTADEDLRIERLSSDAGPIFGREPTELIGRSIFRIVHRDDLPALMWALAQSTSTGEGVSLHVHINRVSGGSQLCQMLLLPLNRPPSFAFALLPAEGSEGSPAADIQALLWETRRGIEAVGSSRDLAGLAEGVPGLSELSTRELDVVKRLLDGDRVPAIARSLFVAQSTVRNQLSSVFRKLEVRSQQGLIDLLRSKKDTTSSDQ